MARRAILNTILFLRIFTLLALAASIMVMVLNKAKDVDGSEAMFYDTIDYRYVIAVGGIGVIYTLIQLPFAKFNFHLQYIMLHKRRGGYATDSSKSLTFMGTRLVKFSRGNNSQLIPFLLATGVGVGFGISFEFKRFFHPIGEGKKYLKMANISTGILLAGFASMALATLQFVVPSLVFLE